MNGLKPFFVAETRDEYLDKIARGQDLRGYVVKRLKRRIDLMLDGRSVSVNVHGCLCEQNDEFKTWHFLGNSHPINAESFIFRNDFAESFSVGRDRTGLLFKS